MNAYAAGRRVEWEVVALLQRAGFVVMRAAGSNGAADVMAGRADVGFLLVQCRRSGRLDPAAWNQLYDAAQVAGAVAVLAEKLPRHPIRFWRLTARKDGIPQRQPREPFEITERNP